MPWLRRRIVFQSIATRCMRSCYCLKHYEVLNIISVHSMQVASFRWAQNEMRLKSGPWSLNHAWWNTYTQLSSCFRDPSWMFGCSYTLPMPVKHVASPIPMYTVNLRHKFLTSNILNYAKLKSLMALWGGKSRLLVVPSCCEGMARVKVELLWQTALDI